jgi:hypothetical protein
LHPRRESYPLCDRTCFTLPPTRPGKVALFPAGTGGVVLPRAELELLRTDAARSGQDGFPPAMFVQAGGVRVTLSDGARYVLPAGEHLLRAGVEGARHIRGRR